MKTLTTFQDHTVHEIVHGPARLLVAPEFGARLLFWEVDGQRIIHWPDHANWTQITKVRGGNPILFPFPARHMVDGAVGKWKDDKGVVRDLPMHGFARNLPFEAIPDNDPYTLRMRLEASPATRAGYPFEFVFDVIYKLEETTLEARFETTNTGSEPLPYYAGHHFYLALPHEERAQWQVSVPCMEWGRQNPDGSIAREPATTHSQRLDDPAIIDRFHLELGQPVVLTRDDGLSYTFDLHSATPWYDVTTWTMDAESDFFCVEPWLGLPNAIHHGQGLRMLAPGQTEIAMCRINV